MTIFAVSVFSFHGSGNDPLLKTTIVSDSQNPEKWIAVISLTKIR